MYSDQCILLKIKFQVLYSFSHLERHNMIQNEIMQKHFEDEDKNLIFFPHIRQNTLSADTPPSLNLKTSSTYRNYGNVTWKVCQIQIERETVLMLNLHCF